MRTSRLILWTGVVIFLSVAFSLLTSFYIRPAECRSLCDEPRQAACPTGTCRFGEQRAGFPLPFLIDDPGGSSPTSGWGRLGPEDLPNPFIFLLDVVFYGALLWGAAAGVRFILSKKNRPADSRQAIRYFLISTALPLMLSLALLGLGLSVERSFQGVPVTGQPQTEILGDWQTTDVSSGKAFIFRFYEGGRLSISRSDSEGRSDGRYQWVNSTLRITFSAAARPAEASTSLCAWLPSFMANQCHYAVSDPAAYPEDSPQNAAYPAPPLEPMGFSSLDENFTAIFINDNLTLSHPSGTVQVLRRMPIN